MDKFFTYPFRYTPSKTVRLASEKLIGSIASNKALDAMFREGKMMGVLVCEETTLYAFSGLAGGKAVVEGFVPPIFDYTDPEGHFRRTEAQIMSAPPSHQGALSRQLQDWLFDNYKVHNALGEQRSIREIFAERGLVPPGGTGECAGAKLLEYAYRNSLSPREMGEFWYGAPSKSSVRVQGHFYPSCTGKCGPLLTWMLKGLNVAPNPLDAPYLYSSERILYSDGSIIVVDKPSGMLSVPGKTAAASLLDRLQATFGEVYSCHRLDQDTSGVMVFARTLQAKVEMERQFSEREVKKTYRARLMATNQPFKHARRGTIALPLMLDYYERPCQMVDHEAGKMAITRYEVLDILPNSEVDIRFYPQTGRTHQLRVHAAHADGLGRPIKGDHLYGGADGDRLFLHAESLEFTHPASGEKMKFESLLNI